MQRLTPVGENIIGDIARRYNLSFDSAVSMLASVNQGGGTMAQFNCPELGGGQWMRGGMTMVGDMFNHGLKNTVNNLCGELSHALANNQMFPAAPEGSSAGNWWPGDLGSPSSSGGQNNTRYAFFPQACRLAVEHDGQVTVYNTLDHRISGVSQQQGGNNSLTFSSQYGTISTLSLPLVSGPGTQKKEEANFVAPPAPEPSPRAAENPPALQSQGSPDVIDLLEKLGQLRDSGILTPEEFSQKKAELLQRL